MDQKAVEKFELKIEDAMRQAVMSMGRNKLPIVPTRHTLHLMAKAAVSVYEAAVENRLAPEEED